ncbi:MAG: PepSY domain-containing protein [Zymomonas sp.]|nr:MAG: PepSY domain-containing protein [Zymomonas sp.]
MRMRTPAALFAFSLLMTTGALAVAPEAPPANAAKLSDIVAKVETRPEFSFIDQVSYSGGVYQIVFYMKDGAEVRMEYDVRTGNPIVPKVATSAAPAQ